MLAVVQFQFSISRVTAGVSRWLATCSNSKVCFCFSDNNSAGPQVLYLISTAASWAGSSTRPFSEKAYRGQAPCPGPYSLEAPSQGSGCLGSRSPGPVPMTVVTVSASWCKMCACWRVPHQLTPNCSAFVFGDTLPLAAI